MSHRRPLLGALSEKRPQVYGPVIITTTYYWGCQCRAQVPINDDTTAFLSAGHKSPWWDFSAGHKSPTNDYGLLSFSFLGI